MPYIVPEGHAHLRGMQSGPSSLCPDDPKLLHGQHDREAHSCFGRQRRRRLDTVRNQVQRLDGAQGASTASFAFELPEFSPVSVVSGDGKPKR